jgi:hypothetical protein
MMTRLLLFTLLLFGFFSAPAKPAVSAKTVTLGITQLQA